MSDAKVTNLGEARRKKKSTAPANPHFTCPDCGKDRFAATVFVQPVRGSGEAGDVVGYLHPLRCVNCGWAQP